MRILVTGGNGFLLRNFIPLIENENEIIYFNHNVYSFDGYYDIDVVMHFASPSDDFEFKDKEKTAKTMIDLSMDVFQCAKENKAKFIFASSMAADNPTNSYGVYKLMMEHYIQDTYDNYLILKIPRVYGIDKNKGLMKKLNLKLVQNEDMNNVIEYIDVLDFNSWFSEMLTKNSVKYYYKEQKQNTIREIKEIYCKF